MMVGAGRALRQVTEVTLVRGFPSRTVPQFLPKGSCFVHDRAGARQKQLRCGKAIYFTPDAEFIPYKRQSEFGPLT